MYSFASRRIVASLSQWHLSFISAPQVFKSGLNASLTDGLDLHFLVDIIRSIYSILFEFWIVAQINLFFVCLPVCNLHNTVVFRIDWPQIANCIQCFFLFPFEARYLLGLLIFSRSQTMSDDWIMMLTKLLVSGRIWVVQTCQISCVRLFHVRCTHSLLFSCLLQFFILAVAFLTHVRGWNDVLPFLIILKLRRCRFIHV